ncbi:hypothetical protein Barb6XT_02745 [Bacteroidales bacterium Barb6XT]|nr:hypothetical protein Barb6XT_02745 [Bacteroidales bacterium Barb6XT]
MRKFNLSVASLVWNLLPPHKRQPVRFSLLNSLINLAPSWADFEAWRSEHHRLINMSSQAISLLGWLRMKFGDMDIRILPWSEELMEISLFEEGQFVDFGYPEEAMVEVARSDERYYDFETCDFLVILPEGSDVDREALRIEIDKFIPIDVKYKVIQQEDLVPPQDELPTTVGIYFYALALQDYLRISTASDGISAIPLDDYLTPVSLLQKVFSCRSE